MMLRLPAAFTEVPARLAVCNPPPQPAERQTATSTRLEYLRPDTSAPYMDDVIRAFRIADRANVYIEVGTQDKGNIAWLARTKLAKGATIIDIDMLDYPDNDRKIKAETQYDFDYHAIRGDCLSDAVIKQIKSILGGRGADVIFCDSHYTYEHTMTEFSLYYPLLRQGGFLLFHDAEWPGDPTQPGEVGKQGKALAIQQLDRFYPAWMVVGPDMPLHRPLPTVDRRGHWGTLAVFTA